MNSEELAELIEKIEAKGISYEKVEEKTKVPHAILKLYLNSGPVPVTIIKNLKKMLEEENA